MILAITAMLIGVALGLRFEVIILVAAMTISSIFVLGIWIALGHSLWSDLLAVIIFAIMLQMGYVGGTIARFVVARARLRGNSPATIAMAHRPAR